MSRCVEETSTTISNLRALQQKLDQQLNEDNNEKLYWKRKCELLGEFHSSLVLHHHIHFAVCSFTLLSNQFKNIEGQCRFLVHDTASYES